MALLGLPNNIMMGRLLLLDKFLVDTPKSEGQQRRMMVDDSAVGQSSDFRGITVKSS
jgi:hypothetical protein